MNILREMNDVIVRRFVDKDNKAIVKHYVLKNRIRVFLRHKLIAYEDPIQLYQYIVKEIERLIENGMNVHPLLIHEVRRILLNVIYEHYESVISSGFNALAKKVRKSVKHFD